MKIYMISPSQDTSFWGFENAIKWSGHKSLFMPLGIITVAAVAQKEGHEVKVTDARFQKIDYDSDADIVCISFYNVQKEEAFRIAKRFKEKGKYVALGGAYPSSSPEECSKFADTVFAGEGEYSFRRFLKDYTENNPEKFYNTKKVDMKESPVPAYELLDIKKYMNAGINFSRGCPFRCEFCDIKEEWFNGRIPRLKSTSQIIKELAALKKLKVRNIFIHDDNFVANFHETKKLLKAIISWQEKNKYKFNFTAEASLNIAHDDEMLDLFSKANFKCVFLGIETPNIDSLKIAQKNQNTKGDLIKDIIKIQKKGIKVTAGMITGFDNDQKDIFKIMYKFIQKTGIIITSLGPLVVLPRTPLEERMKKENRLLKNDIYHPAFLHKKKEEAKINYIPENMTGEELIKGTNWVLKKIYSHKGFNERYKNLIKNMGNSYKNITTQTKEELSKIPIKTRIKFIKEAFLKSKKQFFYNTKTLLKIMITKPSLISPYIYELATQNHIYNYYKNIIGDPDKAKKCPVKLTVKEKFSLYLKRLNSLLEELPNPAVSIDENIKEFCSMLNFIGKSVKKEKIAIIKNKCIKRLYAIKTKNSLNINEERMLLKKDLGELLSSITKPNNQKSLS